MHALTAAADWMRSVGSNTVQSEPAISLSRSCIASPSYGSHPEMNNLIFILVFAAYMSFCAFLVHESHWIAGSLLALLVICSVKIKS